MGERYIQKQTGWWYTPGSSCGCEPRYSYLSRGNGGRTVRRSGYTLNSADFCWYEWPCSRGRAECCRLCLRSLGNQLLGFQRSPGKWKMLTWRKLWRSLILLGLWRSTCTRCLKSFNDRERTYVGRYKKAQLEARRWKESNKVSSFWKTFWYSGFGRTASDTQTFLACLAFWKAHERARGSWYLIWGLKADYPYYQLDSFRHRAPWETLQVVLIRLTQLIKQLSATGSSLLDLRC